MANPSTIRVTLLVIYTPRLEECREFYDSLGLMFRPEHHGRGPEHYAAVLADGTVFELYPAQPDRRTDHLRLSLAIEGRTATPPLTSGRHIFTDPDGRTVEVQAT
ncbi:glyoxalase/bleomycin resistance/dioxygenase family protein [Streptomyces sparsogenes]|uniref:glyoxalase/bleomycin resistance/dioxygenase family protein n=1 Tax=Streptomyces sparsogenes TaxID=67365 RepID=UPI0033EE686C